MARNGLNLTPFLIKLSPTGEPLLNRKKKIDLYTKKKKTKSMFENSEFISLIVVPVFKTTPASKLGI